MTHPEEDAPTLDPGIAGLFPNADPWLLGSDSLRQRVFKVLRPFALMERIGSDPEELACVRGTASDMTVLTSGNFHEIFDLLENVAEDSRYVGG